VEQREREEGLLLSDAPSDFETEKGRALAMNRVRLLLRKDCFQEAGRILEQAVRERPGWTEAHELLSVADSLSRSGAARLFRRAPVVLAVGLLSVLVTAAVAFTLGWSLAPREIATPEAPEPDVAALGVASIEAIKPAIESMKMDLENKLEKELERRGQEANSSGDIREKRIVDAAEALAEKVSSIEKKLDRIPVGIQEQLARGVAPLEGIAAGVKRLERVQGEYGTEANALKATVELLDVRQKRFEEELKEQRSRQFRILRSLRNLQSLLEQRSSPGASN
jgi:hypothetical protein